MDRIGITWLLRRFGKEEEPEPRFPGYQGPPGDRTVSMLLEDWKANSDDVEQQVQVVNRRFSDMPNDAERKSSMVQAAVRPIASFEARQQRLPSEELITKVVIHRYKLATGETFDSSEEAKKALLRIELRKAIRKYPDVTDRQADELVDVLLALDLDDLWETINAVNRAIETVDRKFR